MVVMRNNHYQRQIGIGISLALLLVVIASFALLKNGSGGDTRRAASSPPLKNNEPVRRINSNNKGNKMLIDHVVNNNEGAEGITGGDSYGVVANPYYMEEELNNNERQPQRPPLSDLINNSDEIIGDVQWLLDFAIVGHAKTGTTAQMNWLADHDEVQMYHHEVHSLKNHRPEELVSLLYALPEGDFKRGYKSPNDMLSKYAMAALRGYWPQTKLVIGVRHPVKWFESYYNFNSRQGKNLPPAESMVGPKNFSPKDEYHQHLAMMGKTALKDNAEINLLGPSLRDSLETSGAPVRMENPVFLYEVSQPFDHDRDRAEQYSKDLSDYLGLKEPLVPIVPRASTKASRNYHYAIDVCDDKFVELRSELVELGKNASEWIRTYFLDLPDVQVSQRDQFEEILKTWDKDPCDE